MATRVRWKTPTPETTARRAGLTYVTDAVPGIRRAPDGAGGFAYFYPNGRPVKDRATRERIAALAIPPAYTDVWICRDPNGHLQATGRDDRGRKQYRYHPDWQATRSETKFGRMRAFGHALPALRRTLDAHLRTRDLNREKVLALVVTLMDRTLIRVGNREYARENGSYGLTTLRDRHADFAGNKVTFSFKGKSGKRHDVTLADRRLARLVRRCRDIKGYHLFQYFDDAGARHEVESGDVNAYLREITGQPFTAKDFRTWGGTVCGALYLSDLDEMEAPARKKALVEMVRCVADKLGNTVAVSRKYYVHPALFEVFEAGTFADAWARCADGDCPPELTPAEATLLRFLEEAG